ncbi:MAG: glycine cleavage system aminomethyltransferase GcvT [Candidatus Aureabacteria bacterium]|nr:glycine cleavage system aminomethyltransferase GcvT [Candidatus Auribacterota bacterium]
MRQTPLLGIHSSLGAKIVEFAGYAMPVYYSGIVEEHNHVRSCCGVFDVSHMAELIVSGKRTAEFIDYLTTNAVHAMPDGKVMYSLLCQEDGGCIDDLLVYRLKSDKFLIVANASNRFDVFEWLRRHAPSFDVSVADETDETAMIAVQGLRAGEALQLIGFKGHESLSYYTSFFLKWKGKEILCSRTGYTGEDGFEVFGKPDEIIGLWKSLFEKATFLKPVGLGARDTLRLECCFSLYGHELSRTITPLEAGLGWAVDREKPFIGKDAMLAKGSDRTIAGFEMTDRAIARARYEVSTEKQSNVGFVTSGSYLPTMGKNMGMCLIPRDHAEVGKEIFIDIRGVRKKAKIVKKPFYAPVHRRRKDS